QWLGINALYLTSVFTSPSNHKYDTVDYFAIDPSFGGNVALVELVDALHSRGMRIILDGVFNHCSEQHPFFLDAMARGRESEYWDWFTIEGAEVISEPEPNYACFAGVPSMPEWNHKNPKVREYLLSVVRYWIRQYEIDGWRLDTTDYLPPDFVKDIRRVAKEEKSDAYVVGEVMGLATSWFKHDALDGVMHYRLWDGLVSFFAKGDWEAGRFADFVRSIWHSYPNEANYTSYTLLGSHDKPRFLTLAGGDARRLILAAAFLFTFPGAPAIYYGDEIGLEGGSDPDCRRPFPWEEETWNKEVLETFRRLIHLRRQEACLRRGTIEFITAREHHLVLKRKLDQEEIIVAINTGDEDEPLNLASPGNWIDLFVQAPVPSTTVIPRRGFRILKRV
ncbi:MAG TPA: alpha-glycosidase, partial [Candidatus Acetothermia bacterium]|nr:alpha-glycosidase [Candidatus Acetothermia bacterium]